MPTINLGDREIEVSFDSFSITQPDTDDVTTSTASISAPFGRNRSYEVPDTSDDRTYSASMTVDRERDVASSHDFVRISKWHRLDKEPIGKFLPGDKLMDTKNIETWFYHEAVEQLGEDTIEAAFGGELYDDTNGVDAVRHALLEDTSERIADRIAEGYRGVEAFNGVTSSWPHKARAYLAGYESNYADNGDDSYQEDVTDFADTEGLADYTPGQSTLDMFENGSPFNDDSLTTAESTTAALLTTFECDDIREILDQIEDHGSFRRWLKQTGDAETALSSHYYNDELSRNVIPVLKEPDEWDALDPFDPEVTSCRRCSNELYRVEHRDHDETWVDKRGNAEQVFRVDNESGVFFNYRGHPISDEHMCSSCHSDWQNGAHKAAVVFASGNRLVFKFNSGIAKDLSATGEADATKRTEATEDEVEWMKDAMQHSLSSYFELRPTADAGSSPDDQQDAIEAIMSGTAAFPEVNEPIYFAVNNHYGEDEYYLQVPSDDVASAKAAKYLLENPNEFASA
jgi:hypothetical protein